MIPKLIKLPDVAAMTALRATSIYAFIKAGLLPPPIKLTERSSAWVESEIAAAVAAKIAGRTEAEIRTLVSILVTNRKKIHDPMVAKALAAAGGAEAE